MSSIVSAGATRAAVVAALGRRRGDVAGRLASAVLFTTLLIALAILLVLVGTTVVEA